MKRKREYEGDELHESKRKKVNSDLSLESVIAIANSMFDNGEFNEAIKTVNSVTKQFGVLSFIKGNCNYEIGEYNESIKSFSDAINNIIDDNEMLEECYIKRVECYINERNMEAALDDINKCIEMDKNNPQYYEIKSDICLELDDFEKYNMGIECLNKALELDPNKCSLYKKRSFCYYKVDEHQNAYDDISKAILLNPLIPDLYLVRGLLSDDVIDYRMAIADFTEAIRLDPNCPKYFEARGDTYRKLGEYQKVIDDYTICIQMKYKNTKEYHLRGISYLLNGQNEEAIEDFHMCMSKINEEDMSYDSRFPYNQIDKNLFFLSATLYNSKRYVDSLHALSQISHRTANRLGNINDVYMKCFDDLVYTSNNSYRNISTEFDLFGGFQDGVFDQQCLVQ